MTDFISVASIFPALVDTGTTGNDTLTGTEDADTLSGGEGNDLIEGGAGADSLDGGAGFDTLSYASSSAGVSVSLRFATPSKGDAQGDTISGFEAIIGSAFNDSLDAAERGESTLYGGDGADTFRSNGGADKMFGEGGNDRFGLDEGRETVGAIIDGGAGQDTLGFFGTAKGEDLTDDTIVDVEVLDAGTRGEAKVIKLTAAQLQSFEEIRSGTPTEGTQLILRAVMGDTTTLDLSGLILNNLSSDQDFFDVIGDDDGETVTGTEINDVISLGNGANTILGLGGLDTLTTGDDADYIDGGDGNDVIDSGAGHDTIIGGNGSDVITAGDGDDSVEGGAGKDVVDLGAGDDTYTDIDQGGAFGTDFVDGGDGNDVIFTGGAQDTILGGAGSDTLFSQGSDDVVDGGKGRDVVDLGKGNDIYTDDAQGGFFGADSVEGGEGNDHISTGGGDDTISGSAGNDTLIAGDGNDQVNGGAGRDLVDLGDGDDVYTDVAQGGSFGADTIDGGAGNDTISGGGGNDQLTGGLDADVFVFTSGGGKDTVTDFINDEDRFDVSDWGVSDFSDLTVIDVDTHTEIFATADSATRIILLGVTSDQIDSTDFLNFV